MDKVREIKKLRIEILKCDANIGEYELKIDDVKADITRLEVGIKMQKERKADLDAKIGQIEKEEI